MISMPRDCQLAFLQCDFCGVFNGDPWRVDKFLLDQSLQMHHVVWENHYEQHVDPPRSVNICDTCHTRLHRLSVHRSAKEVERLLKEYVLKDATTTP